MDVTAAEIRTAAYEIALRITPRAWDPTEVKQRATRIVHFLAEGSGGDFDARYSALNLQTIALGRHPHHLNGIAHTPRGPHSRDVADYHDAAQLITAARKILTWIND